MYRFRHHTQFFTATILNWLPLLQSDAHKQILLDAFRFRVNKNQVTIYAFVIMPNHFHCIWQVHDMLSREEFQRDLLKFTARELLASLRAHNHPLLPQLQVTTSDRHWQVWERNSLSVDLFSEPFFLQKFNYIHQNPLQPEWQLAGKPEDYYYSSANFYETGVNQFDFLTYYRE